MGRGFKSAPGTFVENAMFKLPADIMMKTLGKIDESIDENLDTAQLYGDKLDEIKAMQIDNPAVNERVNSLNSEMDELTQSVLDDPAGHRKLTGKFRGLSRKIDKDLKRGMLGAAQGNSTKVGELDKQLDSQSKLFGTKQVELIKRARNQGYESEGGLNYQEDGSYNDIANFQGAGVERVEDSSVIDNVIKGFEKTSTSDTRVKGNYLVKDSDSFYDLDKLTESATSATAKGTGWYDYNRNMITLEASVNGEDLSEEEIEEQINERRNRVTEDILTKKSGRTEVDSKTPISTGGKKTPTGINAPGSAKNYTNIQNNENTIGAESLGGVPSMLSTTDPVAVQREYNTTKNRVQQSINNYSKSMQESGEGVLSFNTPNGLARAVMNGEVTSAQAKRISGIDTNSGFDAFITANYNHENVVYGPVASSKKEQDDIIGSVKSTPVQGSADYINNIVVSGRKGAETVSPQDLSSLFNRENLYISKGSNTAEIFNYDSSGQILNEVGQPVEKVNEEGEIVGYYKKGEEDQALQNSILKVNTLKKKYLDPSTIENPFDNADPENLRRVVKKDINNGKVTEKVQYIYTINAFEAQTNEDGYVVSYQPKKIEIALDPSKYGK